MEPKRFPSGVALSALLAALVFGVFLTAARAADNDDAQFIPTGVQITPSAAPGSIFQSLNPGLSFDPGFTVGQAVTTTLSPDGRTLLILTSGYNSQNFPSGPNAGSTNPAESNEYVFVYDVTGRRPLLQQVLQVPNAFDGLAWNPSGAEFYVSGGPDDDIHVFVKSSAGYSEDAKSPIALNTGFQNPLLPGPAAAGLAVTADGKRLVVANYENDSIHVVDVASRTTTATLDLRPGGGIAGGEFPFWVVIQGNRTAYVTSERDREIVVLDISGPLPVVAGRVPLRGQPVRAALSPDQHHLFVTEGSQDTVAVISTKSYKVLEEISTVAPAAVFANRLGFKGASPNSVAVSPDGTRLYVTNGGANDVAIIEPGGDGGTGDDGYWRKSQVVGLIPTGWYPNSVSVSADGYTLYAVNGKSAAGPNPLNCRDKASNLPGGNENACNAANQYVWQLTEAGFLTAPVPQGDELDNLSLQAAHNNRYDRSAENDAAERALSALGKNVKHVIYIVKENRTYDQILGDLGKGNGDPSITVYPQPLTPNQHAIASRFVDLDNFYDSGEVSGDGWNWSTAARASDTIEKTIPINYAGRGLNYDYEGTNRNINVGLATVPERQAFLALTPADPNLLPGTNDVSAVDGPEEGEEQLGYLWDSALRGGLSVRNYGFFLDGARYSGIVAQLAPPLYCPLVKDPASLGLQVAWPAKQALLNITDPYFRGFDTNYPDLYRAKEWLREFREFEQNGNLPNLEFVRIMADHTGSGDPGGFGVDTPELQTADNDYALGVIVDAVSHSAAYKNNTVIFALEDDSQDGPDHVDAHRSIAFVAGANVKRGAVVSRKYTTVSFISTIVDILGMEHLGLTDYAALPMADIFKPAPADWAFNVTLPAILVNAAGGDYVTAQQSFDPTYHVKNAAPDNWLTARYSQPLHDGAWWIQQTKGMDFSREDRLDANRYNRLLWEGVMGEGVPYPESRSRANLRRNRKKLLQNYYRSLQLALAQTAAPHFPSAGGM
jgi:DNA-binding beta-propeller fold protein YncE